MNKVFISLIDSILAEQTETNKIYFSNNQVSPPAYSYQVNFPRLEFVLYGEYHHQIEQNNDITQIKMRAGDIIYLAPNCWNKPNFQAESSVVSLLFGKKNIGFSFVGKKANESIGYDTQKHHIIMPNGYAIESILSALNTLNNEKQTQPTDRHLIRALLCYVQQMLEAPAEIKTQSILQDICIYIQNNYQLQIDRNSIADTFNVSPNHLSRIFRQDGHMKLADYIAFVRIDRAKYMLRNYPLKLAEVAQRCGYNDVNYFCRVFKNKTGRTPSEYRLIK